VDCRPAKIDLTDAFAHEIAPPPRGFKLMMEALEFSRVHNIFAAAGAQRRAFTEALRHAAGRSAFGAPSSLIPWCSPACSTSRWSWRHRSAWP
jgi:alkylation response protein AidB-like acyl-CoA dehydrogenase